MSKLPGIKKKNHVRGKLPSSVQFSSGHLLSRVQLFATPWTVARQASLSITNTHAAATAKSLQSCPTLCDPIDGSPPGSIIPGILQARTLEWVAISFSSDN